MSSPSPASPIPDWLARAHTSSHLLTVLSILSQRERARAQARALSRHNTLSRGQHLTHVLPHLPFHHQPDHTAHYSVAVGASRENQPCNRYVDVTPYDRTRVVVLEGCVWRASEGHTEGGRYLNANWVRERAGGKWWIASQAPLPNTAHAFLSLILAPIAPPSSLSSSSSPRMDSEEKKISRVRTVVQLTANIEGGKRKAHVYFPETIGQSWVVQPEEHVSSPPLRVTLVHQSYVAHAQCLLSRVAVEPLRASSTADPHTDDAGPRGVVFQHLLYASWPDHGVPTSEDRASLLQFAQLVDAANRDVTAQPGAEAGALDPDPPAVVNCSAGIGRTGAFIALASLLRTHCFLKPPESVVATLLGQAQTQEGRGDAGELVLSPQGPLPEELQQDLVAQEIDMLREQRPGMVQKDGQIVFIYEMLVAAFEERGMRPGSGW